MDGGWFVFQVKNLKRSVIFFAKKYVENMTKRRYNKFVIDSKGGYALEHMGVNMRLKALRKESRLTQEQLAKYLDVDQTLITKFENGSRAINVTMVDKLCSLFGCTQEYLLGQSEEYIPLNFAFRSQGVSTEDLQSIAAVNKIVMNLRCMNELIGGE